MKAALLHRLQASGARAFVCLACFVSAPATPAQTPPPAAPAPSAPAPSPPAQSAAPPVAQATPRPANVSATSVLVLIRSVLIALDQANKTGNYSVLRDLGSPDFRFNNTAARLAEIFADQRKNNLDLSNVAVLEPRLTMQPQIDPNGMMHFAGFYPANAGQLKFEFLLQAVNNQWELYGLAVNYAQAGANAGDGKPQPAAAAAIPNAPPAAAEADEVRKKRAKATKSGSNDANIRD